MILHLVTGIIAYSRYRQFIRALMEARRTTFYIIDTIIRDASTMQKRANG